MNADSLFFQEYYALIRPYIHKRNAYLAKYQLYSAQWSVMELLAKKGAITSVEIAQQQAVEKPTVTNMVKKLIELGYAEAEPGKDKREKKIRLTSAGHTIYREAKSDIDRLHREALQGVDEEEIRRAGELLAAVRKNLTKQGEM